MCGIIGAFQTNEAFKIVQNGLHIIEERGKDGCGYYDGNAYYARTWKELVLSAKKNVLGHTLHAVVDVVKQPIIHEDTAISINGEIYNWQQLKNEYGLQARNDSELVLQLINKKGLTITLNKIQGVYAFAYWNGNILYLVRDILGIKSLWYRHKGKEFIFCSEKKGIGDAEELNPRTILKYNLRTGKSETIPREFFVTEPEVNGELLKQILTDAVRQQIPQRPFGLLFSGGLDSVILAKIMKDLGEDFTCYTAATSDNAPDILAAKKAALLMKLKLKYKVVGKEETETYLKKVVPLIEDNNVIKVGVALPLYIAAELAKNDGKKVIFSGSGADELFGGYKRYRDSDDIKKLNKDCYADLLKLYERNTYRDDVVTMNNNLELRVPYLDREVVAYALRIKPELKIHGETEKFILRELAKALGIPKMVYERKKKAAQYGSGFDKTLEQLARPRTKSEYLYQLYPMHNLKLGALISSGKDSWYAAYIMKKQNYDISCIITMKSTNPESYMFHVPNVDVVKLQAEAMNCPLILRKTKGEKEKELDDLEKTIQEAKVKHGIQGIVSGALFSTYQRERIERIADKLGIKIFTPLWHMNQEEEMQQLLKEGFSFVLSAVAADQLDKSWLGRTITQKDIERLVVLHKKNNINIAFEGGEAESLVLDCPLFTKRLVLKETEILEENQHTAQLVVKRADLEEKQ